MATKLIPRQPYPRPAGRFLVSNFQFLISVLICVHPWFQTPVALAQTAGVKTGLDVLVEQNFAPFRGRRVGLITNHTGVTRDGRTAIDLLARAPGVTLVALFSPEHGIRGQLDEKVAHSTDPATGLPIYSLYGETRRLTDDMLRGIDALIFDIQDAGVRFYTYKTTMAYAMEEAARRKIPFFVLDRPDPLGGEIIEGPMLDPDRLNFVGYFPMPVRFAMTHGELARMFNVENKIGADLHVIPMQGWRRGRYYDQTGLPWIAPSPNLRTLRAAFLYPGIEILQSAGVSVGRGTDTPFELFGAPWIRSRELLDELQRRRIPGVRFRPLSFTPRSGLYKDQPCEGLAIEITDRARLRSMTLGLEIVSALWKLYPQHFKLDKTITLLGSASTLDALRRGVPPRSILSSWSPSLARFRSLRSRYLLYR